MELGMEEVKGEGMEMMGVEQNVLMLEERLIVVEDGPEDEYIVPLIILANDILYIRNLHLQV
jgi:hypothetical protein